MTSSAWTLTAAVLLLLCLGSFLWAMVRFFSRPAGASTGAKIIGLCGFVFGFLHLRAIFQADAQSSAHEGSAAVFYVAALGLFWWAVRTNLKRPLSAIFSRDVPEHLIQEGPYRFIRHPFYCSYLLTWMGGVLATQQLLLLVTVAVMFALYLCAARMEEQKFGCSSLGPRYERYQARTGLFLPNPIKLMTQRGVR
jgi:protein-S-isoprenylcysteine O-methyltransferase Ste14